MTRLLAAALLSLSVVGCCGTLSRETAYHEGVKDYTLGSGLLDQHEKYLDADPKLNARDGDDDATKERKANSKRIRKTTVTEFRALIAEEEKALDKED
jgi:hypothetical protein